MALFARLGVPVQAKLMSKQNLFILSWSSLNLSSCGNVGQRWANQIEPL